MYAEPSPNTVRTAAPSPSSTTATTIRTRFTSQVLLMAASYKYEEPGVMNIAGQLYGVAVDTRLRPPQTLIGQNIYVFAKGDLLMGTPNYDGSTQSGKAVEAETKDRIYNLQSGLGVTLKSADYDLRYDLSAGLGYHNLNDRIQHANGYEREQIYYYSPLNGR